MKVLLISDIHANLASLEAVLRDASCAHPEAIWCLGDLVGYGPQPNECIETLRQQPLPTLSVAGNHDWACLGRVSLGDFNPDARRACQWTAEQLSAENQTYLADLPTSLVVEGFTLVHGSPRQPIWEYVLFPSLAAENYSHFQTRCCLVGHTHIPSVFAQTQPDGVVHSLLP
ncbi:MAG: metallophosphoesterase family protein, partial [Chloroflexi bacterium]|nr:metallophosphoesterase family protein [Chloroflexota bacterium]